LFITYSPHSVGQDTMEKSMEIFWRCFSLNGMKDIRTLQENEIKINKKFWDKKPASFKAGS